MTTIVMYFLVIPVIVIVMDKIHIYGCIHFRCKCQVFIGPLSWCFQSLSLEQNKKILTVYFSLSGKWDPQFANCVYGWNPLPPALYTWSNLSHFWWQRAACWSMPVFVYIADHCTYGVASDKVGEYGKY